ncbi:MAG: YgjP-like metallopeptidase domain-containing protein, partial [Oscillospiraceae bacterium]
KIYISANKRVSEKYLLEFAKNNADYIEKNLKKEPTKLRYIIPNLSEKNQGTAFVFGKEYCYKFIFDERKSVEFSDDILIISAQNTAIGQGILEEFYKMKLKIAVDEINGQIYDVFKNFGVDLPNINFRKMKSRWGSCHYNKNKIFFKTALAAAPMECIFYVLFHEYTHFLYPNHQKEFHDFVGKFIPQYKQIKCQLNIYDKC